LDFDIPVRLGVPEFSFITVDSKNVFDAFMAVKSDASGLDGIPLSFVKILLPVVLPALTHLFDFIFTCSEVLLTLRVFFDFRPISLLPCLSKVCEVVMAGQFQWGFIRNHTTIAVLKVMEDIRLNLEDGQATVLVMLDFTQAFDMIAHDLMVCTMKASQRYPDGATTLLGSYLSDR
jgi:hypothetical protein